MADIRIKDLTTTASSTASDDFIAVDGATNGTRKLNAYSPSFGGNATVAGTLTVIGKITNDANASISGDVAGSIVNLSATGYGLRVQGGASGSGYIFSANDYTGSEKFQISGAGNVSIPATTASTSTSTGALVVSGGVGVAKDLYVGGTVITLQPGSGTTAPQQKIIGPSGATYGPSLFLDASASTSGKVYIVGSGLSGDNGGLGSFYVYDVSAATSVLKIVGGNTTLAGTLAVSGNTNTFGAGGTGGANSQLIIEGGSAANGGGAILYRKNGTVKAYAGMESSILGGGSTSDNYIIYTSSGLALTVAGQQVQANATTASTSTSTGALVVSGGVGVAKEVYVGKTCKVGTGSDNEGYTNVFTNKAENTAGPFDITLPSDCVGVVFLNSYQGGVGRSFREIPFICFGGTVTLGTSRTTVLTADPVTSVAAAASSKITISLYAANTNCYWGIYVNKS